VALLRDPAVRAWARMLRLSQKVQPALAERLRALGLNLAEFEILGANLVQLLRRYGLAATAPRV
jgi:hypothetical protein